MSYVYKGVKYNSLEEVKAAINGGGLAPAVGGGGYGRAAPRQKSVTEVRDEIDNLLKPEARNSLNGLVEKIFNQTAGANRALDPHEVDNLVKTLEREIGIGKAPQAAAPVPACPNCNNQFQQFVVQQTNLRCGACQRGLPARMTAFTCQGCNIAVCMSCGGKMVPPTKEHIFEFGDASQMMHRFDFGGNGSLDLKETEELVLHMMRVMRDAISPDGKQGGTDFARKSPKQAGYEVGKQLGKGGQGAIHIAKRVSGPMAGQSVVIKFYDKSNQNAPMEDIMDEFEMLCALDSPNIARVYEVFQDNANVYAITEPYSGGDLTTFTEKAQTAGVQITNAWIQKVYMQILDGFIYLHGHHIMHCDMKEPNAMITDDKHWDNPRAVIIDFGLSKDFHKQSGTCGTPGYIPPEAWTSGMWTPRGDMFSLGVTMIKTWNSGASPIGGNTIEQLQANTMRPINPQFFGNFPHDMQPLVRAMTAVNFTDRPTASQSRKHACFSALDNTPTPQSMLDGLSKAAQKKAGIADAMAMFGARKENLHAYKELNELFLKLDDDKNGTVTEAELRSGLTNMNYPQAQISTMVDNLCDGGVLNYTEFMARLLNTTRDSQTAAQLSEQFQKIDKDGSGTLDIHEIRELLKDPAVAQMIENQSAEDVLRSMDPDGKGHATFEDFRRAMNGESAPQSDYNIGDKCECNNGTQWIQTQICDSNVRNGAVKVSAYPDYWCSITDQHSRMRKVQENVAPGGQWDIGSVVYYNSATQGGWIPCQITQKSVDGQVMINLKPNFWFAKAQMQSHLKTEQNFKADAARGLVKSAMG